MLTSFVFDTMRDNTILQEKWVEFASSFYFIGLNKQEKKNKKKRLHYQKNLTLNLKFNPTISLKLI